MRDLPAGATPNLGVLPASTRQRVLLVCGEDPDTVDDLLTVRLGVSCSRVLHHREFHTRSCSVGDVPFTCCVTGIGSASVEIALNELFETGGRWFVHTGTSATLNARLLPVGKAAIVDYAFRDDGASLQYVSGRRRRVEAHPRLVNTLWRAAKDSGLQVYAGVGVSTDAFYACGAAGTIAAPAPAVRLPLRERRVPVGFTDWLRPLLGSDVPYCLDMEVSTFYTLAELVDPAAGVEWASVKGISNELPFQPGQQNESTESALREALQVALAAIAMS